MYLQEEDTINTASEQTRLKDIPVPVSVAQTRVEGTNTFELPSSHIRAPPPQPQWPTSTGVFSEDDPVDWDVDPAGFRFLQQLNRGERGYSGTQLQEAIFEKIIDRFEKAVKADVMPELAGLKAAMSPLVDDAIVIDVAYAWWLERRKQLAMPLIRMFRPAPDPEDPDTTGVAFRPREKEGVRRLRSNNKKTYNLMASLHDEFTRLKSLCELVKKRERLKAEFHQASGEYTEAAHRTLLHRLHRQRTGQGGWKDDLEDESGGARPAVSHKKGGSSSVMGAGGNAAAQVRPAATAGTNGNRAERSHHKKRQPGPGRPPKEGMLPGTTSAAPRPRDRDRDRHRRPSVAPPQPSSYTGLYLRPSDSNVEQPTYEDVDSEEEAFNQMVLTIDTQKRDELTALLPRHLREIQPPEDDDAPVPHADMNGAADIFAGGVLMEPPSYGLPHAKFGSSLLSLGAAAEAVAAGSVNMEDKITTSAIPAIAASSQSSLTRGDGRGRTRFNAAPDDARGARVHARSIVARFRVGRGGRVLIDRGRGGGARYTRTCWHTVDAGMDVDGTAAAEGSHATPREADCKDDRAPAGRKILSAAALSHMLRSGRECPPKLLEQGQDPDTAWRRNEPLAIKRGPLLFDFSWLPKPSTATPPDASEEDSRVAQVGEHVTGQKRKADGAYAC